MKTSLRTKLEKTADRYEEVGHLLGDPSIAGGSTKFRELSMEYAKLEAVALGFGAHCALEGELRTAQEWAADSDPEMRAMGEDEQRRLLPLLEAGERHLGVLLVPVDPRDARTI